MFSLKPARGVHATPNSHIDSYHAYALSTGPSSYITHGFDRHLLRSAHNLTGTKYLFGSSTAALRSFAVVSAFVTGRPAIDQLIQEYIRISYMPWYGPQKMSKQLLATIRTAVRPSELRSVIDNTKLRMVVPVTVVPSKYLAMGQAKGLYALAMDCMHGGYSPPVVYFHSGKERPAFLHRSERCETLSPENVYQVLLATTGVPIFTEPVRKINGLRDDAWYMDGGVGCHLFAPKLADRARVLMVSAKDNPQNQDSIFSQPYDDDRISVVYANPGSISPSIMDFANPCYMAFPDKRSEAWAAIIEAASVSWPTRLLGHQGHGGTPR